MIVMRRLSVAVALAAVAWAAPAAAQFGNIFGGPPRPPGDIPQPRYERDPRLPVDEPPWFSRERAPEPPPPPLTRLPPRQDGVQSTPLPPPPGAPSAAPPPPSGQDDTAANPPGGNPLPGLPPGQRQPRGTPQPGSPQSDEVVVAPPTQKIENPTAVFAGLDKITGRIISFEVAIDETVQFGALRLTPRACYTRPPTELPNTDGFVEVDEITLQGEVKRLFTGWMFAASPGLHGIEHPIYDVWLTDCKATKPSVPGVTAQQTAPAASAPAAPAQAAPAAAPQAPARAPASPPARPAGAPALRR
ncbi:MAG: DUF2155 domain-containing protein [Rhizobiales bacterium]|nr:DUF2155 domain-containing protein [Hyphomicrobiales bacterium]